jgi:hypothetical protein
MESFLGDAVTEIQESSLFLGDKKLLKIEDKRTIHRIDVFYDFLSCESCSSCLILSDIP